MRENPRANDLARRAGSCAHPIPYACMSAPVRFMVDVWVVCCVVVSPVFGSSIPVVSKLVLRSSAVEPPKLHVHHLAPVWDNSIVNNPCCCGVVCLNGAFGLGPSHIDEGLAVGNHLLGSDKEGCKFRFCNRCHNKFDDLGNGEHSTIELWVGVILGEEDMCPSTAARLGFIEETSVSMCAHDHVASSIDNAIIWVGCNIIE
jgi:hypothetical protein